MPAHTERLAPHHCESRRRQIDMLSMQGLRDAGKVVNHISTGRNINDACFRYRLARVQRFQRCQFVVTLAQNGRGSPQDCATLGRRRP